MKTSSIPPFGVRMEKELKDLLAKQARKSGRSFNPGVGQNLTEAFK